VEASLVDTSLVKMTLAQQEASPFANWQDVDMDAGRKQVMVALVDTW